ncbi:MAG: hypothetical protein ACKVZJ_01605 [Phycisphaerales bacterium]
MTTTVRLTLLAAALALVAGFLATTAPRAAAAPEPEAIPRRWELRVEPGELRCMTVTLPGQAPRAYFYFTFKATNLSGQDLYFAPSFDLAISDGTVIRSGRDVPAEAVDAIMAYVDQPFLQEEIKLQGQFLQGPENAKEGLVVWAAPSLKATEATIYMAGFSGETKSIRRPDTGKSHVLRKTLMLRHEINGEIDPSLNSSLTRSVQRWILR